jgi:hypothetical protein
MMPFRVAADEVLRDRTEERGVDDVESVMRLPPRERGDGTAFATSRHPLATEPRTLEQARSSAARLVDEIRAGADFGELARRSSVASNAREAVSSGG